MQDQKQVSPYRGLPSDTLGQSATAVTISNETVQLYYNNAGTLTADAGQAAGTSVLGVLAYDYSLDKIQSCQGKFGDSSLSFTSTALTTEVFVSPEELEKADAMNWKQRLSILTASLSNGQYVVDYRDGVIYGKKASITTTLTGTTYVIATNASVISGGNVASGSADIGAPVKVGGVYNLVPPTLDSGDRGDIQLDSQGDVNVNEKFAPQYEDNTNAVAAVAVKPLAVATYSWSFFQNLGANATLNVKASAGNVLSLYCHNLNAAPRYIQIHNTATTPGGGAVPAYSFLVPANSVLILGNDFFGPQGTNLATGIAFAFSTTEATYTAGAAGDQVTQIFYV